MALPPIHFIDRVTGTEKVEKVYGARALALLYGDDVLSRLFGPVLLHTLAKWSLFSRLYGWWQRQSWTRRKVAPFIDAYQIDTDEFLKPAESYRCFDDFFIRELKPEARPIVDDPSVAVTPADGRYYCYQDIDACDGFVVKGRRFDIGKLLGDPELAERYRGGSMVLVRLCPTDYHRFHFPVGGIPDRVKLIAGWLYSVNPAAIRHNVQIFTENKRTVTTVDSPGFGTVGMVEVGATNVGSIRQTYIAGRDYGKGDEKGFFSFGGSAMVLLFEKGRIVFDADLLNATERGVETRCLLGQSLGRAPATTAQL